MSDVVIRTKVESVGDTPKPERVSGESHIIEKDDVEPTPSIHAEIKDIPFTAKYLEIENTFKHYENEDKDAINEIDSYFKSKVAAREFADTKDSFDEYFKGLEKVTQTKNAPLTVKVAKIAEFIKYLTRTESL